LYIKQFVISLQLVKLGCHILMSLSFCDKIFIMKFFFKSALMLKLKQK